MNPLAQLNLDFEKTRKEMLEKVIRKRYGTQDVSESFIQDEVNYYIEQMNSGKPALTLRPQTELTDAKAINDEMSEFEIDIHSVFGQLDQLSQRISQHQKLNESIVNDVRLRIQRTDEALEKLSYQIRNHSAHSVFFETFLDYKNKERDLSYYTEKDGEEMAPAYQLTIDPLRHALKLPVINQENKLVNFAGVKMANIHITKQLGSGFIRTRNPEHSVEKTIDTSMATYWNESILTDEPLQVNLGLDYYGLDFGATCELEIVFDYLSRINELTFVPFTEYPVEIVSILVYDNDHSEEAYELVSPTAVHQSMIGTDTMSYQFQEIVAKRIKIVLNQQHYVKRDVIVNVDDKTLVDAWLKNHGHIEIDEDRLFKPVEQDHQEQYPFWGYMKDYMAKRSVIEEIQRYDDVDFSNRIHLSKYEYQYGLYNIAANRNEYFYEGVHVTPPITNTSVHLVELEAKEEHPILETLRMPVTNIEYYVTDIEKPGAENWVSILPKETKEIVSERLYPVYKDGAYVATTRFDVNRVRAVRSNGDSLLSHIDYTIAGRSISIHEFDPGRIYTVDYKPDPSAYTVDFMEQYTKRSFDVSADRMVEKIETKQSVEEFFPEGQSNELTLAYFPFVDKNELNWFELIDEDWNATYLSNAYLPFKVRILLPNGQYIDQQSDERDRPPFYVVNKTDYYDMNRSLLEPFNGMNYQYRIEQNKIKFNTILPAGTKVIAEYPYLTGPIRMKIIMRRNLHDTDGLTPLVHEYKLSFQSLL